MKLSRLGRTLLLNSSRYLAPDEEGRKIRSADWLTGKRRGTSNTSHRIPVDCVGPRKDEGYRVFQGLSLPPTNLLTPSRRQSHRVLDAIDAITECEAREGNSGWIPHVPCAIY